MDDATPTDPDPEATLTEQGIEARYLETDAERVLVFERQGAYAASDDDRSGDRRRAIVAQNCAGYGMLKVRDAIEGDERERYYGFDMALDHAAELLGVESHALPIPDEATDMGM